MNFLLERPGCSGKRILAAGVIFSLVLAVGCGDGRPKRVPVSGRVLIDGQPLEVGFVQVLPAKDRPATGALGHDGRFTLTTFDDNDGCVLGNHPVVVIANKAISPSTMKWFAPKKYIDSATTGLRIEITGPKNDLEIKLTWEGSGHNKAFIEKEKTSTGDESRPLDTL